MQTHDGGEQPVLEPPHDEFFEVIAADVRTVKTADVGVPPRNSAHCHVKTCFHLTGKAFKGGFNVARPHERSEFLTAEVGTAGEGDNVLSARGTQAVISHFRIVIRIQQCHHIASALEPDEVVKVLGMNFGFGFVKPKPVHTVVNVVFFYFAPHIVSCGGVGHVNFILPAVKIKHTVSPSCSPHEHIVFTHVVVVFTAVVDGGPHGHHEFCVHLMQFIRHGFHIGPVLRVKFVVPLFCPVEVIGNDNGKRNAELLVFACHGKQFFLRFIAQSALPEARCPGGHFRSITC